jgi:aldehyde dehydrogenase (NAD+)
MRSLRVGDPLDKNTDVGAINSAAQLATIRRYLALGESEGAERVEASDAPLPAKGYWCRPTYFTGVQPSHTIAREEIFGPVLAVMTFRTPDEAILRANNTPYGLSAGVWTDKGSKIFEVARRLQGGRRLVQHLQPLRRREPLRRLPRVGLRPRRRPTGTPRLSRMTA